ncbi:MAG: hypothetical protein US11_C0001G0028 [Candidatus Roizmanbacteria bacterium GW2011_GWA2_36_23]|uniref:Hydrogenase maturation protease n=1 Tax=Candidatus Roizmanbacteria bacterium GW2011_GWA2_36_23 TaxID=1618480 RepID=A0A0G0GQJ4_9BACT|nr:MAG: hypothetical protein US11_C0001G0028 [Candidatus Roizmanbacteria bacterium GW2011_GWA2_36_23]
MKIYVFGNPLVPEDSLPLKYLSELERVFPDINFITVDPNENFPPQGEHNLIILDTVQGIEKPVLLNLSDFESHKKTPVSPHDYDLLFHLLLLKKLGKINTAKIIGIPQYNNESILKEVRQLIINLLRV